MHALLEPAIDLGAKPLFAWIARRLHANGPKATKRGFLLRTGPIMQGFALLLWFGWFLALALILLPPFELGGGTIFGSIVMWFIVWPIGWLVTVTDPAWRS